MFVYIKKMFVKTCIEFQSGEQNCKIACIEEYTYNSGKIRHLSRLHLSYSDLTGAQKLSALCKSYAFQPVGKFSE